MFADKIIEDFVKLVSDKEEGPHYISNEGLPYYCHLLGVNKTGPPHEMDKKPLN